MDKKNKTTIAKVPFFDYNDDMKTIESLSGRGIWVKSIGVDKFWASNHTKEILGLDSKDRIFPTEIINNIIGENELEKFKAAHEKAIKDKKKQSLTLKISIEKESGRQTKYVKLQMNHNKDSEGNTYLIGTIHDITKRKKKNDELIRHKEKAEQSNKVKTAFLTNLSYEIRNPMNTIIGFTELMNIEETPIEKRKEYSNLIIRRSRELLTLMDDIIELSKFDSGQITLNKSEFNLNTFLQEIHELINKEKKNINKNNIIIELGNLKDKSIKNIYSDSGRLQEVLIILLDNALKHTEKGMVQFGYEITDNKFITFFVKDTGIEISKEEQKNIFQQFRQVEYTSIRKAAGAGLGLALSKSIIDLMGGKIWVEAEPGIGATFFFTIPYIKTEKNIFEESKEKTENSSTNYNWKNKVILVVDDEEVNFKFMEAVLCETQAQILHANNGKQAVELCQSIHKIDLVLMDLRMPKMNGNEALKEIKKIKNIPVIAQSAYAMSEIKQNSIQLGFDDFVTKPIDIKALLIKLNKFLID